MSFSLRFGDFTLDGCAEFHGSSPYRVTEHRFPRRPGTIAPRVPAKDSKRVVLRGEVWKDSEAQIIAYFELLGKKLDAGRDRLYLRADNRYLNAVAEAFDWTFTAGHRPDICATYNLGFLADDPYWYAPQHTEQVEAVGATNTYAFAVSNSGGARTPPVIEVTRTDPANDQADITLTHTTTGQFMKWSGSIPVATNAVTFDCVNKRVTALGANGLNAFTGTLRLELEPGVNNFLYAGPGNVSIVIAWQERWGQS